MSDTNKFFIHSDTLIKVLTLTDAETEALINVADSAKLTLCRKPPLNPDAAGLSVTANGGGKTKIPIAAHGLVLDGDTPPYVAGDEHVRIQGSRNYEGEADVHSVPDANNIIIDKAFVLEKFTGNESIYFAVKNGHGINLTHGGGDANGYWDGIEPDTLIGLIESQMYYLFVEFVVGASKKTFRVEWPAVYDPNVV